MSTAPPTPAERLAAMLLRLIVAVDGPSMYGPFPRPLALLIMVRIRTINVRFRRLAARILAGTYAPRPAAPRRQAAPRQRRPNTLPRTFGWLSKLLPDMAPYRGYLLDLLADPAMAALVAAAPGPARRPLRSLCRMLGVAPPPLLAIPRPPPAAPKPPPTKPPPAKPPPAKPRHPQPPAWMPRRTRWTLTRIRGSPKPA